MFYSRKGWSVWTLSARSIWRFLPYAFSLPAPPVLFIFGSNRICTWYVTSLQLWVHVRCFFVLLCILCNLFLPRIYDLMLYPYFSHSSSLLFTFYLYFIILLWFFIKWVLTWWIWFLSCKALWSIQIKFIIIIVFISIIIIILLF